MTEDPTPALDGGAPADDEVEAAVSPRARRLYALAGLGLLAVLVSAVALALLGVFAELRAAL